MTTSAEIVIIGGSFAGLNVFKALIQSFKSNPKSIHITLIEKRAEFQLTTGNVRSIVDLEFAKSTWLPYVKLFTNTHHNLVTSEVTSVLADRVVLDNGKEINFDYLVFATGTRIPTPFQPTSLNSKACESENKEYVNALANAKSVLLIGGGAVNIEAAGEIITYHPNKKVTIVSASPVLLNAGKNDGAWLPLSFGNSLKTKLNKKGVDVILNDKVDLKKNALYEEGKGFYVGEKKIETEAGVEITSDVQIVAVGGYKPNSEAIKNLGVLDERGFVRVKKTLQVEGFDNIFALGDVAATGADKMALQTQGQASVVASNISILLGNGVELKNFDPATAIRGIMVTVGKTDGLGFLKFTIPAFFVKFLKKDLGLSMWKHNFV